MHGEENEEERMFARMCVFNDADSSIMDKEVRREKVHRRFDTPRTDTQSRAQAARVNASEADSGQKRLALKISRNRVEEREKRRV